MEPPLSLFQPFLPYQPRSMHSIWLIQLYNDYRYSTGDTNTKTWANTNTNTNKNKNTETNMFLMVEVLFWQLFLLLLPISLTNCNIESLLDAKSGGVAELSAMKLNLSN